MNKIIAQGFLEELSQIKVSDVWKLIEISAQVGGGWPEWRIRYDYYSNRAMELNRASAENAAFDALEAEHVAELKGFLTKAL